MSFEAGSCVNLGVNKVHGAREVQVFQAGSEAVRAAEAIGEAYSHRRADPAKQTLHGYIKPAPTTGSKRTSHPALPDKLW